MGDFRFGQKLGMMKDPKLDYVLQILNDYSWRLGAYDQFLKLSILQLDYVTSFLVHQTELGRQWHSWSTKISSAIKDKSSSTRGRFSVILDSVEPHTENSPLAPELWAEGSFMMLAGSDTSAIAMCATLFDLTQKCNVDANERIITEIRQSFSSVDQIRSGATLELCTFLSALGGEQRIQTEGPCICCV
ncbi:MAG: hypothetical protein Q9221_005633 [Calogaya cf. arnoldii]